MEKQTITIYDVAREAGVSMATVSRVVNGNPNVKPATRKKVNDVIQRLDYRPNAVARGLASKRTTTVGVIIPSVSNVFFASLARGIDDIAVMYKYNIILANSDENPEKEVQVFNTLLAKQVDGIIYLGNSIEAPLRREIKRTNTPVVLAGTVAEGDDFSTVNIRYMDAIREATEILLNRHERIALITGPEHHEINRYHYVPGYKDAYEAKDIKTDDELIIQGDFNINSGETLYSHIHATEATAAIVANDEAAVALLNELQDRNISVPDDFEIITSHNSIYCSIVRPKLTSIQLPLYDLGAVAMRLLTKIMANEEIDERHVLLPYKIVERNSTK
ncbi:catabolite control protein A [Aerococcaceae bacterium zg-B36]|uniref:catabolite control protein A n=1 Tax=Aerococcaceae bacterium zg-252 TaxID=2796928 RepID=UPI001BD8A1CF|nr:catabolite control protein A [Aerococcaceae bacterium zg-B36]